MAEITPEALVNVELAAGAEVSVEAGGSAEIRVELTPAAEIAVELTPAAEVTVELSEGPAVDVELEGGPELLFMGEGALDGYYDKSETDALLERKAEAVHDHDARYYTRAETDTKLSGKSDTGHDHDGRYYTEAETDALLALKVARAALLDLVYPVGAIYMSVSDASPASLFGGTWERITGRFLLAATDGGAEGGNSNASIAPGYTGGEAAHQITTAEMAQHNHGQKSLSGSFSGRRAGTNGSVNMLGGGSGIVSRTDKGGDSAWGTQANTVSSSCKPDVISINDTHTHDNVGSNAAHNNMPPYLAVYVWKRVS